MLERWKIMEGRMDGILEGWNDGIMDGIMDGWNTAVF